MGFDKKLVILSGNAHKKLAVDICDFIKTKHGYENFDLSEVEIGKFSDQETKVDGIPDVRGADVFIIQPTCTPANDYLMELFLIIDAVRRSSAKRITAVMPYYGYARQDRKVKPRVPISASLVAQLLTEAGAKRLLTMDLHAGQIQGFFKDPVDNLFGSKVILPYIKENFDNDLVIVSPDVGGVERARAYATRLNASLAIIDKRREEANKSEVMNIVGDVSGKTVITVDDMFDTAGTISNGAIALAEKGAKIIYAFATHPVLSGPALDRLNEAPIEKVVVTDTIPLGEKKAICPKLVELSIAPIFGEAIVNIFEEKSVSKSFD
jgi:ribose-phosphate pyrophosphokinase